MTQQQAIERLEKFFESKGRGIDWFPRERYVQMLSEQTAALRGNVDARDEKRVAALAGRQVHAIIEMLEV